MTKTLRKRFDLPLLKTANSSVREDFELEKHATRITGLLLVADRDDLLYHRGTVQVLINGEEVIPDDHHAKLFMSGLGVAPKDRFLPLSIAPGNGIVKIVYTDKDNSLSSFATYNVSLYLEIELEDEAAS